MTWKLTWQSRTKGLPRVDGVFNADSPERCEEALRMLKDSSLYGVDVEGYGLDVKKYHPTKQFRALSLQFATDNKRHQPIFVPLWGQYERNLRIFKKELESDAAKKVLHGGKFDRHVLANHGVIVRGFAGDSMVEAFCYDTSEQAYSLEACCERYFGEGKTSFAQTFRVPKLRKDGTPGKQFRLPSLDEVVTTREGIIKLIKYSVRDPKDTVKLHQYLEDKLRDIQWTKKRSYWEYYKEFELPFADALFNMERVGCALDVAVLEEMLVELDEKINEVDTALARACVKYGADIDFMHKFNPGSAKQVGVLLEDQLGGSIPFRAKGGQAQTDDFALHRVKGRGARAVSKLILERRRLIKFRDTYVSPLISYADIYGGFVHTNLKQIGTKTMRLSSSAPNLQNIPSSTKDDYGIRRAFIAPEGMVVGDIDLSQIEIRLMCHFTGDAMMTRALNEGWDLHALTATRTMSDVKAWMGAKSVDAALLKQVKDQFPDARRKAKTLNFGIGYGMGATKYAAMTDSSEREGYEAINGFFALYPGLKNGIRRIQQECGARGYVRTILGRYLQIPGIRSESSGLRKSAERRAFNYTIQGSAADLLKMSMILIDRDDRLRELGVQMTLQIHDELLFNIPKGAEKKAKPIIEEYVSHPYRAMGMKDLRVDTPADLGVSSNWHLAKEAA